MPRRNRYKKPKPRFEATFHGRDVFECEVGESHVSYTLEFERVLVARWWGIPKPSDFETLDSAEQARLIAAYRTEARIGAVVAHRQYVDALAKQSAALSAPKRAARAGRRR